MKPEHLGAAGNGLGDWLWQRASAIVLLVTLPVPFVLLLGLIGGELGRDTFVSVLAHPLSKTIHSVMLLALLAHAYLGLKVIAEDYVPRLAIRLPILLGLLAGGAGAFIWAVALVWSL